MYTVCKPRCNIKYVPTVLATHSAKIIIMALYYASLARSLAAVISRSSRNELESISKDEQLANRRGITYRLLVSKLFSMRAFTLRARSATIATIATIAQCECDTRDRSATRARSYLWDPAKSNSARLWARLSDPSRATANHRRDALHIHVAYSLRIWRTRS